MNTILSISAPHWVDREFSGYRGRNRISLVEGLPHDHIQGHSYDRGDALVEIDASIAPIIVALNDRGYKTLFCCSCLPEDHEGPSILFSTRGYISFDGGGCPPRDLTPTTISQAWGNTLWEFSYDKDEARSQWTQLASNLGVQLVD